MIKNSLFNIHIPIPKQYYYFDFSTSSSRPIERSWASSVSVFRILLWLSLSTFLWYCYLLSHIDNAKNVTRQKDNKEYILPDYLSHSWTKNLSVSKDSIINISENNIWNLNEEKQEEAPDIDRDHDNNSFLDVDLGILEDEYRIHILFSTDCTPFQHYQALLLIESAIRVGQRGSITRIISGCERLKASHSDQTNMEKHHIIRDHEIQFSKKGISDEVTEEQAFFHFDIHFVEDMTNLRFHDSIENQSNSKRKTTEKIENGYKFAVKPNALKYWLTKLHGGKMSKYMQTRNEIISNEYAIIHPYDSETFLLDFVLKQEQALNDGRDQRDANSIVVDKNYEENPDKIEDVYNGKEGETIENRYHNNSRSNNNNDDDNNNYNNDDDDDVLVISIDPDFLFLKPFNLEEILVGSALEDYIHNSRYRKTDLPKNNIAKEKKNINNNQDTFNIFSNYRDYYLYHSYKLKLYATNKTKKKTKESFLPMKMLKAQIYQSEMRQKRRKLFGSYFKKHPLAASYGLGYGWLKFNRSRICGTESLCANDAEMTNENVDKYFSAGPPYILHQSDWLTLLTIWPNFTQQIYEDYPYVDGPNKDPTRHYAEMYGYSMASAHLEYRHTLLSTAAKGCMVGWSSKEVSNLMKEYRPELVQMNDSEVDAKKMPKKQLGHSFQCGKSPLLDLFPNDFGLHSLDRNRNLAKTYNRKGFYEPKIYDDIVEAQLNNMNKELVEIIQESQRMTSYGVKNSFLPSFLHYCRQYSINFEDDRYPLSSADKKYIEIHRKSTNPYEYKFYKRMIDPYLLTQCSLELLELPPLSMTYPVSQVELGESLPKLFFNEDSFFTCVLTEMINHTSKKYRLQNTSCYSSLLQQSQMDNQILSIKPENSDNFLSNRSSKDSKTRRRSVNWQYRVEVLSSDEKKKHKLQIKRQ